ncbi:Transposable element Tc1 transposase [Choanephora cucurbitarum]|uniref:Transposable element Tc1 transposase n=1 Tax=Choanephora cucurbitarum TaxID=101091 RepID=A0A1C7N108_9FUNG|nr:Transposable element Tc1 transposase [Choanephora cucurbitarum]
MHRSHDDSCNEPLSSLTNTSFKDKNDTENKCKRRSYTIVADKMRWGVYWLNKEGCNNTTIGKKVRLARETFDESRYSVQEADGSTRVLRRIDERYKKELTVPTTKLCKGGVMVWGCFWKTGVDPLVAVDGAMNRAKCIEVLSENLQPWIMELQSQHDRRFIFQDDGATCHTGALAYN